VHWAAYACWPIAVLHGLGTGTDVRSTWLLALTVACGVGVVVAVVVRVALDQSAGLGVRLAGLALTAAAVAGVVAFAAQGPLKPGWARRAGTPVALLGAGRHRAGGR
jgi:sulfoxide reductase heme-binding subunit YedZ